MALHSKLVTFQYTVSPANSDFALTIKDGATSLPVTGYARKSIGSSGGATVQLNPGNYTAVVEAVNLAPDASNPVYSDPATSAAFVIVDVNAKPPTPISVTVSNPA